MEIYISIPLFIILLLLVVLTSFFSFAETAIASLNKIKIISIIENSKKPKETKKAKRVLKFAENFNENITSIIIINNVINILASTLSTALFGALMDGSFIGYTISFFLMTLLIIVFGEIIPKMLARKYAESGAMKLSWMIWFISMALYPLTYLLSKTVKQEEKELFSNDDEIMYAITEAANTGVTSDGESEIINRVLKLDSIKVNEFVVKKKEVQTILSTANVDEIKDFLVKHKHTRYPLIENGKVIAIFSSSRFLKDYILNNVNDLKKYQFGFKTFNLDQSASEVFKNLKQSREKLGIVIDKNNQFYGIVTLEDVNELVLGEMYDENDDESDGVYPMTETNFIVEPKVKMSYFFNEYLKKEFVSDKYKDSTIAEWAKNEHKIKLKDGQHFTFNDSIYWVKNDKYKKGEIIFEIDIL